MSMFFSWEKDSLYLQRICCLVGETDIIIQVTIQNCKSNNRSCHRIQQRLRMINSESVRPHRGNNAWTEWWCKWEYSGHGGGGGAGHPLQRQETCGQKHVEAWKGKREWELQLIKDYRIWWSWRFWQSQESFILLIKALLSTYHLPLYDLTFNYMM